MKVASLIFYLVFTFVCGHAQVSAWVFDKEMKLPVAYANIGVKGTSKGTVSGPDGRFELSIEPTDVLLLSALGYDPIEVSLNDGNSIFLTPKIYKIPVVEIAASAKNDALRQYGRKNKNRGESIAFGSPQLGACLGAPISINEKVSVESLNFVINHAKGDSMLFRVQLYDFREGGDRFTLTS